VCVCAIRQRFLMYSLKHNLYWYRVRFSPAYKHKRLKLYIFVSVTQMIVCMNVTLIWNWVLFFLLCLKLCYIILSITTTPPPSLLINHPLLFFYYSYHIFKTLRFKQKNIVDLSLMKLSIQNLK
jgi:hypothetical protein